MNNQILAISLEKKFAGRAKDIKKTASKILGVLKQKNVGMKIYLAGNQKMRFLNRKFRGKNKAANILSFSEPKNFIYPPAARGGQARKIRRLGEIYLNVEQKEKIFSTKLLIAHGILHLLGYDHETKQKTIKMERVENRLFRQIRSTKH